MPSAHLAKWNKASILHWLRLSLSFYYGCSEIHLKTSKDGNISFPRKTGWQTACRLSLLLFSCLSFQKNQWVSLSYIRFYTNHFLIEQNEPAIPILNWQVVQLRSSWGVLILIGGGYAIADASDASGFSDWVADGLASVVDAWEPWTICLLCSTMAALFTEITSNSASCALFVPLLNKLALRICVHPLYLTLPATIACSLSFMLPVATPPNAIAFGTGRLLTTDTVSIWLTVFELLRALTFVYPTFKPKIDSLVYWFPPFIYFFVKH